MNLDERMEELASLYVVGILEGPELREFEAALRSNPELRQFVARLGKSVEAVAGAVPAMEPPPQLRAKILAQIEPPQKVLSLPERRPPVFGWLRALVTCLMLLCLLLAFHDKELSQTVDRQAKQIADLHELADNLQSVSNNLQMTVLSLKESNRLANLRIAMLNSLVADAPKTVAVTLWDNQENNGVFVVENLKALPADRDYQLWVMDENKNPVAAGVFHMDASGTTRMDFKPTHPIKTAGQFCVTEEIKGGVPSPTLKNLILASN